MLIIDFIKQQVTTKRQSTYLLAQQSSIFRMDHFNRKILTKRLSLDSVEIDYFVQAIKKLWFVQSLSILHDGI